MSQTADIVKGKPHTEWTRREMTDGERALRAVTLVGTWALEEISKSLLEGEKESAAETLSHATQQKAA